MTGTSASRCIVLVCLAAPDRAPLATMFRSLRWVFSMAWIGQVVLQMSFLMIGAAMLQAGAQELSLCARSQRR